MPNISTKPSRAIGPDSPGSMYWDFIRDLRAGKPGLLIEGDSWSNNPTYRSVRDILHRKDRYAISFSDVPGKLLEEMRDEKSYLSRADHIEKGDIRCFLLSGGGNDLLRKPILGEIILTEQERGGHSDNILDYLHLTFLDLKLKELRAILVDILEDVWQINPKLPVLMHGYDYPIPADRPADFHPPLPIGLGVGPWLHRILASPAHNVPPRHWQPIASFLIDRWNEDILEAVEAENPPFIHVDLRGKLTPRNPRNLDELFKFWGDEIHPNNEGFKKITRSIEYYLSRVI